MEWYAQKHVYNDKCNRTEMEDMVQWWYWVMEVNLKNEIIHTYISTVRILTSILSSVLLNKILTGCLQNMSVTTQHLQSNSQQHAVIICIICQKIHISLLCKGSSDDLGLQNNKVQPVSNKAKKWICMLIIITNQCQCWAIQLFLNSN